MKVVFENATIADSVSKAARVAPTKGTAFDKASGILMELNPDNNTVTIKATNLDVFYMEVVDTLEVTEKATWRFPSQIMSQVMSKLPIGSGKNVTLEQKGNEVHMNSGRTVVKFRLNDVDSYPQWEPFDPDKLDMVPDLGARIKQVEWSAEEDHDLSYSGIHLSGTHVMATDHIRLVRVPCEAEPIYRPITIPAGILQPVLANLRDVAVGIDEGMFILMPDPSTQIKTVIYAKDYPTALIDKVFSRVWPDKVTFKKTELLEIIERAVIFVQRDRAPKMTFIVGKGEIAVMCTDAEIGLLGDAIELGGQCDHNRRKIIFTPKNLTDALSAAPSESIDFWYDSTDPNVPVKIDGGSGYEAVVMPRREAPGG